jgi:hypothetical protein
MKTIDELLKDALGYHVGAAVPALAPERAALRDAGMIGANGGLTLRGSIRAERMKDRELDDLFGSLR